MYSGLPGLQGALWSKHQKIPAKKMRAIETALTGCIQVAVVEVLEAAVEWRA